MPAQLDDPLTPAAPRRSGMPPTISSSSKSGLPASIEPLPLTLRDGSVGTLIPFGYTEDVPPGLNAALARLFNAEVAAGDTYPMLDTLADEPFRTYWFGAFAAVAVVGGPDDEAARAAWEEIVARRGARQGVSLPREIWRPRQWWEERLLGTYYVKPNYPGRSSHVCNAGFLVAEGARGKGVGRALGETYLKWAPALGYSYSVFNLVYATNTASRRIWDGLGFEVIGRVPGCGNLRSSPGKLVDALIYGRRLGAEDSGIDDKDQGSGAAGASAPVVEDVVEHEGPVAVDGV